MEVVPEMQKLRKWIDEKKIEWEDKSQMFPDTSYDLWICRTHFFYNKEFISVINGFGTYGGYLFDESNKNLLEIMKDDIDGQVRGYLTADDVINILGEMDENKITTRT